MSYPVLIQNVELETIAPLAIDACLFILVIVWWEITRTLLSQHKTSQHRTEKQAQKKTLYIFASFLQIPPSLLSLLFFTFTYCIFPNYVKFNKNSRKSKGRVVFVPVETAAQSCPRYTLDQALQGGTVI